MPSDRAINVWQLRKYLKTLIEYGCFSVELREDNLVAINELGKQIGVIRMNHGNVQLGELVIQPILLTAGHDLGSKEFAT